MGRAIFKSILTSKNLPTNERGEFGDNKRAGYFQNAIWQIQRQTHLRPTRTLPDMVPESGLSRRKTWGFAGYYVRNQTQWARIST